MQPSSVIKKLYLPQLVAALLLAISFYFFKQQHHDLKPTVAYLRQAQPEWLALAAFLSGCFILLQSGMYVSAAAAVGVRLRWPLALALFLKRNLIAVFVPGGSVSALAFTPTSVKRAGIAPVKLQQASALFAFAGLVSLLIVGLPTLLTNKAAAPAARTALGLIAAIGASLFLIFKESRLQHLLLRRFPKLATILGRFTPTTIGRRPYLYTLAASVGVELCGIAHLYVAMLAVGATPSFTAAALAYITTVLLMVASPFLKGMGAVELSLVYLLSQAGYAPPQALAIALVYRFFEFWVPFAAGIIAFLQKTKTLVVRLLPSLSIFILGLVNILSVVTPPIKERLHWVKEWLPADAIQATNVLVLFIGLVSMVCAAFLIKGLRNAWWVAVVITALSLVGHLAKAWDYEEALVSAGIGLMLLLTRGQYRYRGNARWVTTGLAITFLTFVAVLIYGFVGFYFLEKRHFGIDFTWRQSVLCSVRGFLLLQVPLQARTPFGHQFVHSFYVMGVGAWSFLFISVIRPYLHLIQQDTSMKEQAQQILAKYSHSMLDYFKLTADKQIFLAQKTEGFVSYTIADGFAIALEEPVCAPESKGVVLQEFERFCKGSGLRSAFYRIDESATSYFTKLKKKKLLIGQEALLDVGTFTLNGRDRKSLRNGLNSLQKHGYVTTLHTPPHAPELLQQLKAVSDAWLARHGRTELRFSQGAFDEAALQQQPLITTCNAEGRVVAFLNIVPSFAPGECTYDLIRKTADAPGGCMDALIIALIEYAKHHNFQTINLGLASLSGIVQPQGSAEHVIKYAYEHSRWFRQYRGLRAFKEKYATVWRNKYLVYGSDFDLLRLPHALKKAMRLQP